LPAPPVLASAITLATSAALPRLWLSVMHGMPAGGIGGRFGLQLPRIPERKYEAVVGLDEKDFARDFAVDGPAEAVNLKAAGGINTADTQ
jgi:hypothetical protein